jgi:hypothetical protein
MNNQPHIPGVERRKKQRVRLETSTPAKPLSSLRILWLVAATILAIAGLVGLLAIFWMGVVGEL